MKKSFNTWLLLKLIGEVDSSNKVVRAKSGRFIAWVSIWINILLFLSKLIVGILINSLTLIADSIHSVSDTFTSAIVLFAYKISSKPADAEHPYGHQRAEYIAALIIAVILIVTGLEFIKEAVHRLQNPEPTRVSAAILVFIIFTIVIKLWLGSFTKKLGQAIESQVVIADAVHHFTDVISSIFVLIAVAGSGFGYYSLDGIGGIFVGIMLIWTGFIIAKESADSLLGKPPSPELIIKIQNICKSIENVINTHDIVVHSYGNKRFISVHVEVDQKKSSLLAHDIGENAENALKDRLNAYATVHVDPVDIDSGEVKRANSIVENIVADSGDIREFHDLRLITKSGHILILFDLVPEKPVFRKFEDLKESAQIKNALNGSFPGCELQVEVDPVYIFN